jgi:hypothetical protein
VKPPLTSDDKRMESHKKQLAMEAADCAERDELAKQLNPGDIVKAQSFAAGSSGDTQNRPSVDT